MKNRGIWLFLYLLALDSLQDLLSNFGIGFLFVVVIATGEVRLRERRWGLPLALLGRFLNSCLRSTHAAQVAYMAFQGGN